MEENVKKMKKTHIFFWKKRYFFYTGPMSNFKIKKLPKEENASENLHEKNQKIKKNMRIFVLCLLGIFFSFFIFSIVAKSIG